MCEGPKRRVHGPRCQRPGADQSTSSASGVEPLAKARRPGDGSDGVVAGPFCIYSTAMSKQESAVTAEPWWTWPSRTAGVLLIVVAIGGPVWLVHRWSLKAIPGERRLEAATDEVAKLRPKMMVLPVGEFRMGSERYPDEQPVHAVKISKRFALSETEVTQGQYKAVMGDNPSRFKDQPDWESRPVEQVSWLDAVRYCNKLSEREGRKACYELQEDGAKWDGPGCQGYRLPTEAEWEYAARADESTEYAGSDRIEEVGWYNENSGQQTHPVGMKKANAWFLKDMSGNVWEWVWDWHAGSYKGAGSQDPTGPAGGSLRVVRGGSWFFVADYARVAYRNGFAPSDRGFNVGFRLARSYP